MDKIFLKNLRFHGRIGVFENEKQEGQRFLVNIELELDLSPAGQSDDLSLTVNYAEVYGIAKNLMDECRCDLVECYGEQLAAAILRRYRRVNRVIVQMEKPDAPIEGDFESVGVVVDRRRET